MRLIMNSEFGKYDNYFMEDQFVNLVAGSRELRELLELGQGVLVCFPLIIWEIFYQLYRGRKMAQAEGVHRVSHLFSQMMAETVVGRMGTGKFSAHCRDNLFGAALATLYLGRELLIQLPTDLTKTANRIWRLEEQIRRQHLAGRASGKVEELLAGLGQFALGMTYARKIGYLKGAKARSEERLKELAAGLMEHFQGAGPVEKLVLAGLEGEQKLERQWAALAGWSGPGGSWGQDSFDRAVRLAGKLVGSPKLERLTRRLGRMKELFTSGDNFSWKPGMTLGNDLNRLVPDELVLMSHPRLGRDFRRRFQEEALWLQGDEGPREIVGGIVCLDNSGSMEGPKEEVAKALTLALWQRVQRQKGEMTVIMFGGPEDPLQIIRLLPDSPLEEAMAVGELFLRSRSTDYEKPLRAALELLEKQPGLKAGITFITDGICRLNEDFLKEFSTRKQNLGFQVTGVVVTYGQTATDGLEAFSDRLLVSTDLLGHDIINELLSDPLSKPKADS
ncbi:MAG: VWA domain-containing protein [Clostridia bacterium]|nr:VWA domain-containing protein [Clostridia bacterium]